MNKPKTIRSSRKASDEDIVRLNSLGLSLTTVGDLLGCHPTTIKLRLDNLGVPAADTRRTFMEDIYNSLSEYQKLWLQDKVGPVFPIKAYVKSLIIKDYMTDTTPKKEE